MRDRSENSWITVAIASLTTLAGPSPGVAQCEYDVTVIKPSPCPFFGPPPTFGYGINELGHVAGSHWQCGESWGDDAAFVWTPESGITLIDLPEGTFDSFSFDVNDAGQVVGMFDVTGDGFSVLGFLSEDNQLTVIPPLAGTYSQACAISNAGLVAGTMGDGTPFFKGFVWDEGAIELLLPTFGPRSVADDINEFGCVVGWMGTSPFAGAHAFMWEGGTMDDLGVPAGAYSARATAINNLRRIVIVAFIDDGQQVINRTFLWDNGKVTDLGVLPGFEATVGWDINDLNQVVGSCDSQPGTTAFLWQNGVMTDLNDLVADESINIYSADAINNAGQIVASGDENAESAALLLTPIRSCPGDLDCDGFVGITDFLGSLAVWGAANNPADLDGDGTVGIIDFLTLLANWGPCP